MARIFMIVIALGFSLGAVENDKDGVDINVIKNATNRRSKTLQLTRGNDSTTLRTTNKTDFDYTDMIKHFNEELKIDDCNKEIKLKRHAVIDLREILGSDVTSKLRVLTNGYIDGETQFSPDSIFAVNHCDKLFTFDNLKSEGFNFDNYKRHFLGDQPLKLVFNYVDVHRYISGITSSASELPAISVDRKGSRYSNGGKNYQLRSLKSTSKRSGDAESDLIAHNSIDEEDLRTYKGVVDNMKKWFGTDITMLVPEHDPAGILQGLHLDGPPYLSVLFSTENNPDARIMGWFMKDVRALSHLPFEEEYKNYFNLFMTIFCKNDLVYSRCAILGYFRSFTHAPMYVPNFRISEIQTEFHSCFINPLDVIFQSSRHEIDGELRFPFAGSFDSVLINKRPANPEEMEDPGIVPGAFFRFLNTDWPDIGHDVRVFIYPRRDSYIFTFPDLKPLTIKRILHLIYDNCHDVKVLDENENVKLWLDRNEDQTISLEYVKIKKNADNLLQTSISVKKRVRNETETEYYQLLPALSFTRIHKSSILFTIDPAQKLLVQKNKVNENIKGDGLVDEKMDQMLGSPFDFQVNGSSMQFEIKLPSNRYAIVGLKQTSPSSGSYEADAYGYLTAFDSLNHFPLTSDLKLDVPLTSEADASEQRLTFISDAAINRVEPALTLDKLNASEVPIAGLKFQMALIRKPEMVDGNITYNTHSCVHTNVPGKISDFINAVHEKPFFSQDWITYGGIGIAFSPNSLPTSQPLCNNNYDDSVDLRKTYFGRDGSHSIETGGSPLIDISSLLPSFTIEMKVTISEFIHNEWTNIFHISQSGDYCEGCRIPSVFVTKTAPKRFYICQTMNEKVQECLYTTPIIEGQETHLKITQSQTSISEYSFQVYVDGRRHSEELTNMNPKTYDDAKVYIGNTWGGKYNPQRGYIKDLKITGGVKVTFSQEERLPRNSETHLQIGPNLREEYKVTLEMKFNGAGTKLFTIKTDANVDIIWIDSTSITGKTGESNVKVCYSVLSTQCKETKVSHGQWTNIRISQHKVGNNYLFTAFVGNTQVHKSTISNALSLGSKKVDVGVENRNLKITAYPTKVGVKIHQLNFVCDNDVTVHKQKACLFLARIFPYSLEITLSGWMNKEELQLQGKSNSIEIEIADGFTMTANDEHNMLCQLTKDNLIFSGMIDLNSDTDFNTAYFYHAILKLSADIIDLRIISTDPYYIHKTDEPSAAILFEGQRIYLQFNEEMVVTDIEMNPNMCFGDPFKVYGMWVGKDMSSRLTFTSGGPSRAEFYACTDEQKHIHFSEFMTMIDKQGKKGFLDGSFISEFCWARTDKAEWEVKELGKTFSQGLSYRGFISTTFGGEQWYKLPLEGNKNKVCVEMPILQWGNDELTPEESEGEMHAESEVTRSHIFVKDTVERENDGMIEQLNSTIEDVEEADAIITDNYICEPKRRGITKDETYGRYPNEGSQPSFRDCALLCYNKHTRPKSNLWNGVLFYEDGTCYCTYRMGYTDEKATYQTCKWRVFADFPIEMFKGTGIEETKGPQFCYILGQPRFMAELSGYLKTFAFEKEHAKFTGYVNEENGWIEELVFNEENLLLFNGLMGSAKLKLMRRDIQKPLNPTSMKLRTYLTFDNPVNQDRLEEQIRRHIGNRFYMSETPKWVQHFEDEKEFANRKKTELQGLINKRGLRRRFQVNGMERARAIKSYKRDCPYECGYAKIPGWTIDHSCSKKSKQGSLSCLKYKNEANIASNVGCIANCEAERARSFVDAKELHKRTTEDAERIEAVEECIRKTDAFITTIEEYKISAERWPNEADQMDFAIQQSDINIHSLDFSSMDHIYLPRETLICHRVAIHFIMNGVLKRTSERICFDGLYDELAYTLTKPVMNEILSQYNLRRDLPEEFAKQHAIYKQFNDNEAKVDPYVKEFFQKRNDVTSCVSDVTRNENAKVRSSLMSGLTRVNWNDFSEYEQSTVEAFEDTSPWEVAKRRNVIEEFSKIGSTLPQKNVTTLTDGNACIASKRALADYNNIVNYIHTWTQEHEEAKRKINSMDIAYNGLKFGFGNISFGLKNYTDDDRDLMNYWQSKMKTGMKEWFNRETDMLDVYNKESLPLIQKQLTYMYADSEHKTLRELFNARSSLEKTTVQRAQIPNSTGDNSIDIGKTLMEILEKGKTLEEIAAPIEDVLRHTDQLQKRSIPC